MKRILIILGVLILFGLLAYPKVQSYMESSNAPVGSSGNTPVFVDIFVVQPDTIEDNIFTTGTLIANEEVELASESSGLIEEIYLKEGQPAEKGQLLIKINDSELKAQLNRAEFRLNLAEDREKRQTQLLEKGGISQEEYDATLNEVNVLRAEVVLIEA